ncbi:MAG: DinB family protein [Chloroflexi bacterium]|nr:DinB family protein [Chloroflexota bacterium]
MQPYEMDVEKRRLIQLLDQTRKDTLLILSQVKAEQVIHPDSGWQVKDLVGHIVFWEEEAAAWLLALKEGRIYTIAEFESFEAVNHHDFKRRRDHTYQHILDDLHAVRERMKAALLALPTERFEGMLRFPWPWRGSLSEMIETMVAHEREHAFEIMRIISVDQVV